MTFAEAVEALEAGEMVQRETDGLSYIKKDKRGGYSFYSIKDDSIECDFKITSYNRSANYSLYEKPVQEPKKLTVDGLEKSQTYEVQLNRYDVDAAVRKLITEEVGYCPDEYSMMEHTYFKYIKLEQAQFDCEDGRITWNYTFTDDGSLRAYRES